VRLTHDPFSSDAKPGGPALEAVKPAKLAPVGTTLTPPEAQHPATMGKAQKRTRLTYKGLQPWALTFDQARSRADPGAGRPAMFHPANASTRV